MPARKRHAMPYTGPERRTNRETRGSLTNPDQGILEFRAIEGQPWATRAARFGGYKGKPFKGKKKAFIPSGEHKQSLLEQGKKPFAEMGSAITFFRDKRPIKEKPKKSPAKN